MRTPLLVVTLALILSTSAANAQFTQGDLIIGASPYNGTGWFPGIVWGVQPSGKIYTVAKLPFVPSDIKPSADNRSLWVVGDTITQPHTVKAVQIDQTGTVTTLVHSFPGSNYSNGELDEAGALIITSSFGQIGRFHKGNFTTLYTGFTSRPMSSAIDPSSGDLIAVDAAGPVYRLPIFGTPSTTRINTLFTGERFMGLHSNPVTGDYVAVVHHRICCFRPYDVTPLRIVSTWPSSHLYYSDFDWDAQSGTYLVPGDFFANLSPPCVYRFDPYTNVISTVANLSKHGVAWTVTIAGSRHLCGIDYARTGQKFRIRISFPSQIGSPYVLAMSFGFKPGVPIGSGRRIHLVPDSLFAASLATPSVFSNFQGFINATGEAVATVHIPGIKALSGTRVFAVAVTYSGARITRVSEPLGITIH